MGLSSLLISVTIIEFGVKYGVVFFMASAILSFLVIGNKIQWLVYVFTFGNYGLIKYLIERDRSMVLEYVLKLIYANIAVLALFFAVKAFVYIPMKPWYVLAFEVVFLIYDYAYSLFVSRYTNIRK